MADLKMKQTMMTTFLKYVVIFITYMWLKSTRSAKSVFERILFTNDSLTELHMYQDRLLKGHMPKVYI